ncbi:unnamed protein product [Aphanomyces euteiches]|uniref:CHCH domain-containing protein n=1 Tax=Aphanomyces euteiches TaxID=100861 RepID=A0A6G0XA92_9STRA|nr:hypothetical protein Ae201684_006851 [Aphanomyces euteiches]KAH9084350.1 hypothetical protein LEN26_020879 [Aphanomyces euteiches]KAH9086586.1 hypothetical protein Ae201684P_000008 [Aphanomyces euteiches]KAH9127867.1 hypothetical protein AeMF1_001886 [Aphanomyces euteiches]KAH9141051.1 hypothetical protein AeRB84_014734 [Aphanomyces euteiches]
MPPPPSIPKPSEVPLHLGSKSDFDDIEGMIERNKCAKEYYKLEECLGEFDRDWTKCQDVVRLLRLCNAEKNKGH